MHPSRLTLETLKLLVGIAWADHDVSIEEMNYILTIAERAGVGEQETESLRAALRDENQLPQPDLELLRQHREDVLRTVDLLINIDDQIVDDERAARDAVARLLR